MADIGELIVLPAIRAARRPNGALVLTQKYLEGVSEFARTWPGPVTSLPELSDQISTDFDHVEVTPEASDTGLEIRPDSLDALMARLDKAAAVLGFLGHRDAPLAAQCRQRGLPLVYVSEYSLETEKQMMWAGTRSRIVRARRTLWLARNDRIRRQAVTLAAGLQCSGMPTYVDYKPLQPNTMVFFDNRIREDGVITRENVQAKFADLDSGRPLRLIFGARFTPMKGVMFLPEMAAALTRQGVDFSFEIYGDGPQKEALQARIAALDLTGKVQVCPPVDFRSGWVPALRERADLFVCPHPQGDPSSTYPEVMSCGVPIVGFDNAAFQGIVEKSGVGWLSPVGNAEALAASIARLDADRASIRQAALDGLAFAQQTTFESTFRARMEHVIGVSRLQMS